MKYKNFMRVQAFFALLGVILLAIILFVLYYFENIPYYFLYISVLIMIGYSFAYYKIVKTIIAIEPIFEIYEKGAFYIIRGYHKYKGYALYFYMVDDIQSTENIGNAFIFNNMSDAERCLTQVRNKIHERYKLRYSLSK